MSDGKYLGRLIPASDELLSVEWLAAIDSILTGFYCTTHKAIGQEFGCDEWMQRDRPVSCAMVEFVGLPKSYVDAATGDDSEM